MSSKSKPPVSVWIIAERKRLGWKVADVSRRLKDLGYEAEESTVQVWEAGRSPKAETIEALERLFGSRAPREVEIGDRDLAAVIAAIDRQTTAIGELAAAIREDRDRISPEGVRLFLRTLLAEGLIVPPEALPSEVASNGEPLPLNAGQQ